MADFKHIVRVVNTDLDGNKPIGHALTKIRGVGRMFASSAILIAGLDWRKKAGELTEAEVKKITDVIANPGKYKFPVWMFNRRKDYKTGEDKHILTSDLEFTQTNDVRRLQKIKSYRGLRHAVGLTVRGQRTRSNFRKNKGKVMGVRRAPQPAPAAK
jgi:small subunit ribosomal protein S13